MHNYCLLLSAGIYVASEWGVLLFDSALFISLSTSIDRLQHNPKITLPAK